MNKFVSKARNMSSVKLTENGQFAYNSTGSRLLDFFATAGALRVRSESDVLDSFKMALDENPLYAIRALFYARNIRGGLGERKVFRTIVKWLAQESDFTREILVLNFNKIVEFGRYDDLYILVGTPLEKRMFSYLETCINYDLYNMDKGKPISLASKWLKSVNTSSKESRDLGKLTAKYFGMSHQEYRKMLSIMRNYIDVVEKKMSGKEWNKITYENVPSGAMKNYRDAFFKHDVEGFSEYIKGVEEGTKKINSNLYPYEIFEKMNLSFYGGRGNGFSFTNWDRVLQAQWDNLPNFVSGNNNVIVMADTSGSMEGHPINVSLSLAFYFAERNNGAFKNLFMTFDNRPEYVFISGNTLKEKISKVNSIVSNTNLKAAFELILSTLKSGNVPQSDAPKALVVISDMEIDSATDDTDFHENMKYKFESFGYEIPTIVYWNVEARQNTFHVDANRPNTILVSGASASTFANVMKNIGKTPYESMIEILNSEIYSGIFLPE